MQTNRGGRLLACQQAFTQITVVLPVRGVRWSHCTDLKYASKLFLRIGIDIHVNVDSPIQEKPYALRQMPGITIVCVNS